MARWSPFFRRRFWGSNVGVKLSTSASSDLVSAYEARRFVPCDIQRSAVELLSTVNSSVRDVTSGGEHDDEPNDMLRYEDDERLRSAALREAPWYKRIVMQLGDSLRPSPRFKGPRGAFVWGPNGSGKTMLADLLEEHAAVPDRTMRASFDSWMIQVHEELHNARRDPSLTSGDPIPSFVERLGKKSRLLILDDFVRVCERHTYLGVGI